jgi:hypothetical protein
MEIVIWCFIFAAGAASVLAFIGWGASTRADSPQGIAVWPTLSERSPDSREPAGYQATAGNPPPSAHSR